MTAPSGERQVPFYCPYCGDEDLVPAGEAPGGWACRSCARSFSLRYAGLTRPSPEDTPKDTQKDTQKDFA